MSTASPRPNLIAYDLKRIESVWQVSPRNLLYLHPPRPRTHTRKKPSRSVWGAMKWKQVYTRARAQDPKNKEWMNRIATPVGHLSPDTPTECCNMLLFSSSEYLRARALSGPHRYWQPAEEIGGISEIWDLFRTAHLPIPPQSYGALLPSRAHIF